jgi:hypothetical protein
MRKLLFGLLFGLLLMSSSSFPTGAQDPEPPKLGQCPPSFDHWHRVTEHGHDDTGHGAHKHVGSDKDHNGDGWLCAKHVGANGTIHVHIDNSIPLKDQ